MEEKVYGEYPGSIEHLKEIDKLSEVELFLAISSLENYILTYKKIISFDIDNPIDVKEDEYALEYLVNQTTKFGVELEKDKNGRVIKAGDYAAWYQYYMIHFNKTLKREEFKKFLDLKSQGYNVSRYLPNYSYLEYKEKIFKSHKKTYVKMHG